ncbi:MAG: hypothetical protein IAE77_28680 [Prosthecobacter sp.]|jgi:hypothetical protein|uniref:hypothetical protein n=1 Tax=Prosthecobacter sp. TaxID=1965333 RepID=UPI001A0A8AC5|nr:hypothetical protein [Prosthecobacter sp.]MBE2287465.1 hypothetical protein [Prosthecobacter sp.]
MHPHRAEIPSESFDHLALAGTFFVSTCLTCPEADAVLPAHSKVIQPLIRGATTAMVWPPAKGARALAFPADILLPERGRYRLDLTRDVFSGHERFWNASGWSRGSIVLRMHEPPNDIAEIFMNCSGPATFSSRYQLAKGDSKSAICYCDKSASQGDVAFCFSASNGIQHVSIFAPPDTLKALYQTAYSYCRPFKRWFECSPGEAVNLV